MKSLTRIVFPSLVVCAMVGCADTPSGPPDSDLSKTFVPVQAHQMKDLSLTCEDLAAEIGETESATTALDKQIAAQRQQSQTMAMLAAFSGVSAATANNPVSAQLASANVTLANAGSGMADNQVMTKGQLRANINQRHDALMAIYFARNCKPT